jgi:anhydro-N-acetylmuramic acid kinase
MTSTIPFPARVIGLMSGTSADGVDAAILRTDGRAVAEAGESLFVPYDDALRADILALMRGVGDEADVAQRLTDVHIRAVQELLKRTKTKADLVGFHGQTIRHAPHQGITVQIGDGARMARELGIPVVADFRTADVKAGGQGAPLVPLYHAALCEHLPKPIMVVNIGGVSNATWIGSRIQDSGFGIQGGRDGTRHDEDMHGAAEGAKCTPESRILNPESSLIGFDIGPGNALIDDWVFKHTGQRYDKNGEIASRGVADNEVVREFLCDPFFLADAPKSLDRNQFDGVIAKLLGVIPADAGISHNAAHASGDPVMRRGDALSLEDGAATLTSMTAAAIGLSFGAVPENPTRVLICGGGRKNAHLMGLLKACVNAPVDAVEAVGWDGDMLEAQAFAYLAARSVQGLPLSLPTTTGVREPMTGGVVFEP